MRLVSVSAYLFLEYKLTVPDANPITQRNYGCYKEMNQPKKKAWVMTLPGYDRHLSVAPKSP